MLIGAQSVVEFFVFSKYTPKCKYASPDKEKEKDLKKNESKGIRDSQYRAHVRSS